jgi:hypothetical protein
MTTKTKPITAEADRKEPTSKEVERACTPPPPTIGSFPTYSGGVPECGGSSKAKPSAALIVAVVALVAALGGGAVAGVAVTSLNKKDKKQVTKIAEKQAKKQIKRKAPGLSVANAERVGGKTASELETPSTYAERTSDALLTSEYQPVLDTSLETTGKRIVATVSVDLYGGVAAAEAACQLAIDSETSSAFDQDIPLVGGSSDATLSFTFAATVDAGTHDIDLACREEEGNVEVIFANIAAVAVDE